MQPNPTNDTILALQAHYRKAAESARDNAGPTFHALITLPPDDLLQMIGQDNDREKLIIANRENQQARAQLRTITDSPTDTAQADLDRLLGKLRRILFTTSPSKEAAYQLHAHLTTILKPYEKAAPAPTRGA